MSKVDAYQEIIKSLKEMIYGDSIIIERAKRSIKSRKKTIRIYEQKIREAANEQA